MGLEELTHETADGLLNSAGERVADGRLGFQLTDKAVGLVEQLSGQVGSHLGVGGTAAEEGGERFLKRVNVGDFSLLNRRQSELDFLVHL